MCKDCIEASFPRPIVNYALRRITWSSRRVRIIMLIKNPSSFLNWRPILRYLCSFSMLFINLQETCGQFIGVLSLEISSAAREPCCRRRGRRADPAWGGRCQPQPTPTPHAEHAAALRTRWRRRSTAIVPTASRPTALAVPLDAQLLRVTTVAARAPTAASCPSTPHPPALPLRWHVDAVGCICCAASWVSTGAFAAQHRWCASYADGWVRPTHTP